MNKLLRKYGIKPIFYQFFRKMKLTILILTVSILSCFSAETYSQITKLTITENNSTLLNVLRAIEAQSEFKFFYNEKVDINKEVSLEVTQKSITEILDKVLSSTSIKYKVLGRQIALYDKNEMEPFVSEQQGNKVTGKVTDTSGASLPGVAVVVKGTTIGVVTDNSGIYSLSNISENATLQFSFVGMKTQEILVGGKSTINVTLVEEAIGIDEVVAIGYGTQKKATSTGSVSQIEGKIISNIQTANISQTLVGRLPGIVAVQNSGEPGGDNARINIRGWGNALIIVDGVEQDYNQLNANEIETFSILKDASAAIYGARAANGVILVTTKRGKLGKPVINFDASYGLQTITKFPEMVNSGTYVQMVNEANKNVGSPTAYDDFTTKMYRYISGDKNFQFTPEEQAKFSQTDLKAYNNTDWWNETFRKYAPMQNYTLSSNGGNENVKYFLSGSFLNQESILRTNDTKFKRYNFRSNVDANITSKFSIGLDVAGRIESKLFPGESIFRIMEAVGYALPMQSVNTPDPSKPTSLVLARTNSNISGNQSSEWRELNTAISFKYITPLKGLTASGKFNYRFMEYYKKNFLKQFTTYNYDIATNVYTPASVWGNSHRLDEGTEAYTHLTSQLFLEYEKKLGLHNLNAFLLTEILDDKSRSLSAYRDGFISPSIQQLFFGSPTNWSNTGSATQGGRISYAGRFNYSYAEKFLLEATFRYDGNPKFTGKNQWGFFPGILGAWRISEEKFMKGIKQLSNLKVRASYGVMGDDNNAIAYQYLEGYALNLGNLFNGKYQNGIKTIGLPNPNATWAQYRTINFGLDFGFFNNSLYGEFDVFRRNGYNLLGTRVAALPTTFGANLPQENINSNSSRGFEMKLGYRGEFSEIQYEVVPNISWNRTKWDHYEETDLSNADSYVRQRYQQSGQWVNRYFGLDADGLFQNQKEIDEWSVDQDGNKNSTLKPGDIKYKDYDGDGKITGLDEHVIGRNTIPEIFFGANINFAYKKFSINMLWQGATNYSVTLRESEPLLYYTVPYVFQTDYWTPDNTNARFPRLVASGDGKNKKPSTFWLYNPTYFRLKNIQIGYDLPQNLFKRGGIEKCRVYFSATNLITFTNLPNFDPEVSNFEHRYYPQQRIISIGVNITF